MYERFSFTPSVLRWRLTGEPGQAFDALVAGLVCAGFDLTVISPTQTYRVDGDADRLAAIAEQINTVEGLRLELEPAPTDVVRLTSRVRPPRGYKRTVSLHSETAAAFSHVARAIDMGLIVSGAGRAQWAITGSTARLMAWLSAHVYGLPLADTLAAQELTPESAAAEDHELPPPTVNVVLPPRVRQTQITRDAEGDIVELRQIETTLEESE